MTERLSILIEMIEKKESDFLLFAVAKEYESDNQVEKAISCYEKLVQLYPNHVGTYYHFASLLQQLDKKAEAKNIIHQGIKICKIVSDKHAESELQFLLEDDA